LKPLHLNLASRPYRDYRPVYAVVVVASLLVAFLMLNNIDTYYRYVSETKSTRTKIAQIEAQANQERRRTEVLSNQLRTIDVVSLDRRTRFINAQLAERAFSWSELLDRLESVLPSEVRITSIAPSFRDDGLVHLTLDLEAKRADGLIVTLNRFNQDPRFSNPFPAIEQDISGAYRFTLTVNYKPTMARGIE
jgi:Tfp pilus assembly protein PilN